MYMSLCVCTHTHTQHFLSLSLSLAYIFTFTLYKIFYDAKKRNGLICIQRKRCIVLSKQDSVCGAFVFAVCTRVLTLLSVVIIIWSELDHCRILCVYINAVQILHVRTQDCLRKIFASDYSLKLTASIQCFVVENSIFIPPIFGYLYWKHDSLVFFSRWKYNPYFNYLTFDRLKILRYDL